MIHAQRELSSSPLRDCPSYILPTMETGFIGFAQLFSQTLQLLDSFWPLAHTLPGGTPDIATTPAQHLLSSTPSNNLWNGPSCLYSWTTTVISQPPLHARSFSHVRVFATLWTVACQVPLSRGFSRQEYWSGLPCPPPGDIPDPGIEPASFLSPASAGGFFTTSDTREALPRVIIFKCFWN